MRCGLGRAGLSGGLLVVFARGLVPDAAWVRRWARSGPAGCAGPVRITAAAAVRIAAAAAMRVICQPGMPPEMMEWIWAGAGGCQARLGLKDAGLPPDRSRCRPGRRERRVRRCRPARRAAQPGQNAGGAANGVGWVSSRPSWGRCCMSSVSTVASGGGEDHTCRPTGDPQDLPAAGVPGGGCRRALACWQEVFREAGPCGRVGMRHLSRGLVKGRGSGGRAAGGGFRRLIAAVAD